MYLSFWFVSCCLALEFDRQIATKLFTGMLLFFTVIIVLLERTLNPSFLRGNCNKTYVCLIL